MENGALAVDNRMAVPQKVKYRLSIGSSNPPSGYISIKTESTNLNKYMHTYILSSIIHYSQKAIRIHVYQWMNRSIDKQNIMYTFPSVMHETASSTKCTVSVL